MTIKKASMTMTKTRFISTLTLMFLAVALSGCGDQKAQVSYQGGQFVSKPDVFSVRPFAVNLEAAAKDQDVAPAWVLKALKEPQTAEDIRAGQALAESLSQQIVTALEARGIHAVADGAGTATGNTVHITGQFVNAGSANDSMRPAIGYRAGKKIETRVQIVQSGSLIAELAANANSEDAGSGGADVARQIADVVVKGYVNRGWLPPAK